MWLYGFVCSTTASSIFLFRSGNHTMHLSPKNRINVLLSSQPPIQRSWCCLGYQQHPRPHERLNNFNCMHRIRVMNVRCVCARIATYDAGGNTRSFHRHDSHKGLWNWRIMHELAYVCVMCVPYGENARNRRESFGNYEHYHLRWFLRFIIFDSAWLRSERYHDDGVQPIYYLW